MSIGLYAENFLDLLFSRTCAACGLSLKRGELHLCLYCLADLPRLAVGDQKVNSLRNLFPHVDDLVLAFSWLDFEKSGKSQGMIHQLKYKGKKSLGLYLGRKLANEKAEILSEAGIDAVVPIPMSRAKKRKRGYNQAALIAKGIADELEITYMANLLIRKKGNQSQTKMNRYDRWMNVHSAFGINVPKSRPDHILLVDDVITTGATMSACIHCIKKSLNTRISILSLARSA